MEDDRAQLIEWSQRHPFDVESLIHQLESYEAYRAVGPDIYCGEPISAEALCSFQRVLAQRREDALRAGCRLTAPNSMNRYGVILSDLGFDAFTTAVVRHVVEPFARAAFPEVAACGLDAHHAFIVEYSPTIDDSLSWHVDDAEVTLNLCLGDSFLGGDLIFRGRRCLWHRDRPWRDNEVIRVPHTPTHAVLHAGADRHEALPVKDGFRQNLIIWCRSTCYRERTGTQCPSWCPEHRPNASAWTR